MIDTLSFVVPLPNAFDIFQVYVRQHSKRWSSRWYGAATVAGPWGHCADVKPVVMKEGSGLMVRCSPKFLFGHNICGSSDVRRQVWLILARVQAALGIGSDLLDRFDQVRLHRIDLVVNLRLDSGVCPTDALTTLYWYMHTDGRSLSTYERFSRIETVYVCPKSKNRALFYNKHRQVKSQRHSLTVGLPNAAQLVSWSRKVLRFEARWGRSALEKDSRQLDRPVNWTGKLTRELLAERLSQLKVSGPRIIPVKIEGIERLKPALRALAVLHSSGVDLHRAYSRRTLRRARMPIADATGIDLFSEPGKPRGMSVDRLINESSIRRFAYPKWAAAPYRRELKRAARAMRRASRAGVAAPEMDAGRRSHADY